MFINNLHPNVDCEHEINKLHHELMTEARTLRNKARRARRQNKPTHAKIYSAAASIYATLARDIYETFFIGPLGG